MAVLLQHEPVQVAAHPYTASSSSVHDALYLSHCTAQAAEPEGLAPAAGSTKEAVAGSEGNAMFHEALNLAGVPVKQRRVQRGSML